MKYSPEIIGEIVRCSSGMFSASEVRVVLELLESTDEQKVLRADAERWRKWIVAAKAPTSYEP